MLRAVVSKACRVSEHSAAGGAVLHSSFCRLRDAAGQNVQRGPNLIALTGQGTILATGEDGDERSGERDRNPGR
jgi:hypothetical protein